MSNINLKDNDKIYKVFITYSILICVFLLSFVNNMTSRFPDAYHGNEASSDIIALKIANQIAIYVWPILVTYLIMLVILIIKKVNHRNVYYPLSLFTLTIIVLNLGIIYFGHMVIWYFIIFFWPLVIILFLLSKIGDKLDNNTITKKIAIKNSLLCCFVVLVISILPVININDNSDETINNNNVIEEQNAKYEKMKNNIKNEFNNLIRNDYIYVSDLELTRDYSTIRAIELMIKNNIMTNNETELCNDLIKVYNDIKSLLNKYNYTSQNINFEFNEKNPFVNETSKAYQKGGYIKDDGSIYLIYLNKTPIEIKK